MEEKRYPEFEEEKSVGMVCEPVIGAANAFTTYDNGGMAYDDDIASDENLDEIDWNRLPSHGPFSEEEAIARIDRFEERLAKGEVKWYTSEEVDRILYEKYPWLK